MQLPKITYIICHHNYQNFLPSAIKSAKSQTYPGQMQICVIDDCSNDVKSVENIVNTYLFEEPVESYIQDLNTITKNLNNNVAIFITDKPHGPSYARNCGMKAMWDETDIFAILDADDENYSEKILRLAEPFIQSDDVGVVYADYDILNVENKTITREYKESFDLYRLYDECIVHSGSLISKKALDTVKDEFGFYDENMRTCEDYDLWIRIAEHFNIIHIAEPLSLVRVHNNNSTNTVSNDIWNKNWQRIAIKKKTREEKHDMDKLHSSNSQK